MRFHAASVPGIPNRRSSESTESDAPRCRDAPDGRTGPVPGGSPGGDRGSCRRGRSATGSSNASSRTASPARAIPATRRHSRSRRACRPMAMAGPETAQGPSIVRNRIAIFSGQSQSRAASRRAHRSCRTSAGRWRCPAGGARWSRAGSKSAKASSTTSQPPCAAEAASPARARCLTLLECSDRPDCSGLTRTTTVRPADLSRDGHSATHALPRATHGHARHRSGRERRRCDRGQRVGQEADEDLRARRRHYGRRTLRHVGLGGGRLQIGFRLGRRQRSNREGWQGGHRIGYGIDPRRQVDPGFGRGAERARRASPGLLRARSAPHSSDFPIDALASESPAAPARSPSQRKRPWAIRTGLYTRIGHPVTWIGSADQASRPRPQPGGLAYRSPSRQLAFWRSWCSSCSSSVVAAGALAEPASAAWLVGVASWRSLASTPSGAAQPSRHVARPCRCAAGGRYRGRTARPSRMIVGRNPESLDEAGVCARRHREPCREFLRWRRRAGLLARRSAACPAPPLYKAVNTADSMIGHRTPRHEAFGWAAARLRRSHQPAGLPPRGAADRCLRPRLQPRGLADEAPGGRAPRCPPPPLAQCGLARGRHGRRAGPAARGTAHLRRRAVEDRWMGDGRAEATPATSTARSRSTARPADSLRFGRRPDRCSPGYRALSAKSRSQSRCASR